MNFVNHNHFFKFLDLNSFPLSTTNQNCQGGISHLWGLEEADKIINALQVYALSYAEYLRAVNDFNNHVSKLRSVSGVFQ